MKLLPSQCILCTPCNHTPCHITKSQKCRVHVCLAITCHLHFWQSDQDLLHATAVTHGWKQIRDKRRHKKLTLEKIILSLLLPGHIPSANSLHVGQIESSWKRLGRILHNTACNICLHFIYLKLQQWFCGSSKLIIKLSPVSLVNQTEKGLKELIYLLFEPKLNV